MGKLLKRPTLNQKFTKNRKKSAKRKFISKIDFKKHLFESVIIIL
jgi:hypothetical protein